jgi:hypothetical protein
MTSLFYPAVLGTVFFSMLDSFSRIGQGIGAALLTFVYVGIVLSFSVDFIYTYSSRSSYTAALFISDTIVLLLLVIGYMGLINAVRVDTAATVFLLAYLGIHGIFLCWDLALIPKADWSRLVVAYDIVGFVVTLAALAFWRDQSIAGVVVLWVTTVFYIVVGIVEIFPRISREAAS